MICAGTADQQILREFCLRIVGPLIRLLHLSTPVWRQSRLFHRGATECQAWTERIYLAAIIRLRLRRAERVRRILLTQGTVHPQIQNQHLPLESNPVDG